MPQADWDFTNTGATPTGGADGSARLHLSLAGPLIGEGAYCREYDFGASGKVLANIDPAVAGGLFDQIPVTKAISLRAYVRITGTLMGCYIGAKTGVMGAAGSQSPSGYFLGIGREDEHALNSNLNLTMRDDSALNPAAVSSIATLGLNSWFKIRMDVIPIGPAEDRIDVYTGTGPTGSEVWTLEHQEPVLNSDPHYVPWGSATSGRVGFWMNNGATTQLSYIDRWQCFLEDV